MFDKVRVLVWEQQRNTIKGLFCAAVAMAVYALLLYFVPALLYRVFAMSLRLEEYVVYVPLLGAMALLFMNESRNEIRFDYPLRMFRLPVSTRVLVTTQLMYKLVVMVAMAVPAGLICNKLIYDRFIIWPPILLVVVVVTALQALVFLIRAYGTGTGLFIFLVIGLLSFPLFDLVINAFTFAFTIWRYNYDRHYHYLPKWEACFSAGALTVMWWVTALVAARRARSDVPADRIGRWVKLVSRIAHFERSREEFSSPEGAQRWYEWRRGAYLFPWAAPITAFVLLTVFHTFGRDDPGVHLRFQTLLVMLLIAPAAVACFIGYTLTRNDLLYAWFVGARPISTKGITRARFVASVKGILVGYGLLLVMYVLVYRTIFPTSPLHPFLVQDLREITITSGPYFEGVLMLAFYLGVALLAVWSLFWLGRVAGGAVWIACIPAAIHFHTIGKLTLPLGDPTYGDALVATRPVLVTFAYALTGLAAAAFLVSYILAYKRGYISQKGLVVSIGGAGVLATIAFIVNDIVPREVSWPALLFIPQEAVWMTIICLLIVPLIPFSGLPLTIDWQRHR